MNLDVGYPSQTCDGQLISRLANVYPECTEVQHLITKRMIDYWNK